MNPNFQRVALQASQAPKAFILLAFSPFPKEFSNLCLQHLISCKHVISHPFCDPTASLGN